VRYRRARDPWYRLVADYEREQWRLRHEAQERNSVVLSQMDQIASELDRIAALERRVDELSGESLQPELERLTRQLSDSHTLLVEANLELSDSHTLLVEANLELQEYHTFRRSAEVRAAVKVGARMRRLLPAGTRRRRAAKAAAHGAMHPQQVVRGLGRRLTGRGRSSVEVAGMDAEYRLWLVANEPSPTQLTSMRETSREFPVRPLISIAVPVHDPEASWLLDAITSVRAQAYENWELCIADDASAKPHVRQILESEAAADPRIKVTYRATNGGIAEASNSALGMATGEFVAFLDHDDVLRPHALFQVVTRIDQCPEADILYSDEDKILLDGSRGSVFFKPNWSPAWLLSQNYITHLLVVRRRLLTDLGGFRTGYDGSQDHDLLLRLTEKTDRIEHIADVLYSWRQVPGSAALSGDAKPLARLAGRQCVEDALRRRGTPGHVELGPSPGVYDIRYELMARPKVSVIIPTRDRVDLLERCLSGIDSHTTYPDLEVIIVDNDSRQPATHEFFANCGHRVVAAPGPFNYSRIVNVGVRSTSTPYAVLLNNDVAVMTPDWIERLLELCQQPDIGVVGCQLRFRDGRMQHAGIGIGYGHLGYNLPMDWPVVRDAAAVTGACMMFKREAFDQVQGFDEKMGVAFNDVDFCLRIRQLGLRVVYTPFRMEHEESSSRGRLNPSADQDAFRARWGGEDTLVDPFLSPHILWPDAGRIRLGSA
jgi:GT2 family glycosyltransferase